MSSDQDPTCGIDVASYALGALEPAEAEAFEAHLHTCEICRQELAEFAPVVDALPLSAPQMRAPRSLRRRVMRDVKAEAKGGAPAGGAPAPGPRLHFSIRPAMAMAAAGLAVLVIAIVALVGSGGPGTPSSHTYAAQVTGPGTASLTVTGNRGELVVHHLPPPPTGKIYEVWLARPHGAPQPTSALFSVTSDGSGDVTVPGSLHGVTQVMVTPEPAGGSRVPTHAPVISAQI